MPPFVFGNLWMQQENAQTTSVRDVLFMRNVKIIRKKLRKNLVEQNNCCTFATANEKHISLQITNGVLTERLGNGLQNRVERFDSARHL